MARKIPIELNHDYPFEKTLSKVVHFELLNVNGPTKLSRADLVLDRRFSFIIRFKKTFLYEFYDKHMVIMALSTL